MENLDVLIKNVQKKEEEERFYMHIDMFDDVKKFIIKRKRILYGGTALNELLPLKDKFYSSIQLPDFDVYSPSPKQDAVDLATYLNKKGYKFIEVKTSLIHETTFKVYAEFQSVADFTYIRSSFYKFLLEKSKLNPIENQSDPRFVISFPPLLIWSFYRELARPRGSLYRLIKILPRIKAFMTYFGHQKYAQSISHFLRSSHLSPHDLDYLSRIRCYIKKEKIPDIGGFAIGLHLKMNRWNKLQCCVVSGLPFFDLLTSDIGSTLRDLQKLLPPFKVRRQKISHLHEILPERYNLISTRPDGSTNIFCRLIDGRDGCYAYTTICGYTIGTIDTILFHLYGNLLSQLFFTSQNNKHSHNPSQTLHLIQLLEFKNSQFSLKERFKLKCIGVEKTKEDFLKHNWDKKLFHFRP
jgi:hypothetical protein